MLDIGIREYREIFFKLYRMIYRVMENNVYVLVIADGRRDMQAFLQRRAGIILSDAFDAFVRVGASTVSPDFSPEVENKAVFRGIIGLL